MEKPRDISTLLGLICLSTLIIFNVWFGRIVFPPNPHQDDWSYTVFLSEYLDGKLSLEYLFHIRNGHFAMPGQLLFLWAYYLTNFDLSVVRWTSILVLICFAIAFSSSVASDFSVLRN